MSSYPIRFHVDRPPRHARLQLAIRLILFILLGMVGISLGLLFMVAYLALPVFAAVRLSNGVDGGRYLDEEGPRVERGLFWFAALYAYFGLLTDRLPTTAPDPAVHLEIVRGGNPDARGTLRRIVTAIPSALVLALLGCVGGLVWIIAAIEILASERQSDWTFHFLEGIERWMLRLLAFQAGLVDAYPPFSMSDEPVAPIASAHG